jgi:hypothetical protein
VRMSQYDIFEDAIETLEDAFENFNDNTNDSEGENHAQDEVIPVRIRHEVAGTIQRTYIDADFNNDAHYEISVELDGRHNLVITEHHAS